jgi:hypothetical protein
MKRFKRALIGAALAVGLAFAGVFAVAAPANAAGYTVSVASWSVGPIYMIKDNGALTLVARGQVSYNIKYVQIRQGQCIVTMNPARTHCQARGTALIVMNYNNVVHRTR